MQQYCGNAAEPLVFPNPVARLELFDAVNARLSPVQDYLAMEQLTGFEGEGPSGPLGW